MKPDQPTMLAAFSKAGGFRPAERLLRSQGFNISERTLRRALTNMPTEEDKADLPFTVDDGPVVDIEELLERRIKVFEKKNKQR